MGSTNPIFRANRLNLGVMAFNCSNGSTVTTAPEAWPMTWSDNVALAQIADRAGFEALLPVGRWKGYGGPSNFNNKTFESFTWAAGIGALTKQIAVLSTIHAPLVHPVMAAKQAATIDHITQGRFVLNLVCGWFRNEFEMFGVEWREHDVRYEYAAE
jgi:FMNH2-dependent dimethyl sulfone monooxygenase